MSRIGKKAIVLPTNVTVHFEGSKVTCKGPKGELSHEFNPAMKFELDGQHLTVVRPDDSKEMKELHGTTRAILNNMVHGVSEGFSKKLLINGIGYRAAMRGKTLVLNMGYSHEVLVEPVEGIEYKLFEKSVGTSKTQGIEVFGIDKQVVGQMAAEIRAVREPEPYLGKGIKYENEVILRKEGKRAGKK